MPTRSFRAKRLAADALAVGHRLLRRTCDAGNRIVTFHSIDAAVDGDTNGIYRMGVRTFRRHVAALHSMSDRPGGLRVVDVGEVADGTVAITFDDGYASTLTVAAPLLAGLGLPFCLYVTPALVDSNDRRYLDRGQLVELSTIPGVTIGAHGYRHVPFSSMSAPERRDELVAARAWLEDVIQREVRSMSYPFGDTPEGIRDDVAGAGYLLAACSAWGFNDASTDMLMMRRIDLWEGDSRRVVVSKLEGRWNRVMGRRTA